MEQGDGPPPPPPHQKRGGITHPQDIKNNGNASTPRSEVDVTKAPQRTFRAGHHLRFREKREADSFPGGVTCPNGWLKPVRSRRRTRARGGQRRRGNRLCVLLVARSNDNNGGRPVGGGVKTAGVRGGEKTQLQREDPPPEPGGAPDPAPRSFPGLSFATRSCTFTGRFDTRFNKNDAEPWWEATGVAVTTAVCHHPRIAP